jgi:hypothetical protein
VENLQKHKLLRYLPIDIWYTYRELTRRKIGACEVRRGAYIGRVAQEKGRDFVLTTPCVARSSGNSGEGADAPRAQASADPGEHSGLNRRDQSRVSSTPIQHLGVQCEGSVRDPIRLAVLVLANLVARPGYLGMEAGAPADPPAGVPAQAVVAGRRTGE